MSFSVEYLGYVIAAEGIKATPKKVEAISQAPKSKSIEILSWFGKLLWEVYPAVSIHYPAIESITVQEKSLEMDYQVPESFTTLKTKMTSTNVLVRYDVNLPLRLAYDASAYGVGAVISHVITNSDEKPIAYASRSLTKSEKNYSQIEKEVLLIIFGIKKFHQFLYGREFTLITDHKLLLAILGPKAKLPTLTAARFQRWAICITAYNYELIFRPTNKHSNADGLSRLMRMFRMLQLFLI